MTKDVLISIRGLQVLVDENGVQEPVEVLNTGQYYFKNGKHYVMYDEPTEGFDKPTHNIIKFNAQKLEVMKHGLIDVHMVFEENKKNLSMYQTPLGIMDMGIATTRVSLTACDTQILMLVEYALELNGEYVGDCTVEIDVRELTKENLALQTNDTGLAP